jgi:hypothetical protein
MEPTTAEERAEIAESVGKIIAKIGPDKRTPTPEEIARFSPPWTLERLNEMWPPKVERNGKWVVEWSGLKLDDSRPRGVRGQFKATSPLTETVLVSPCPTSNPKTLFHVKTYGGTPSADDVTAEKVLPTLDSEYGIFLWAIAAADVHLRHTIEAEAKD